MRGGADVSHIPNADASCGAHIMRGAPQSPLGEAARGGFKAVRGVVMCCVMLSERDLQKALLPIAILLQSVALSNKESIYAEMFIRKQLLDKLSRLKMNAMFVNRAHL